MYCVISGELKLVYFLCTFEMIIFERDDWCLLLIDEEREILEYHNDLKVSSLPFKPHNEKICLQGFRPGLTQSRLCSHRRCSEALNLGFRK